MIRDAEQEMEWVVWESGRGRILLADGRAVHVADGDELLVESAPDSVVFHDHKRRTLH